MLLPPDFPEPPRYTAQEFQRLSPYERFKELARIHELGMAIIKSSPDREAIERQMEEDELEWRRIQQEIFDRYLEEHGTTSEIPVDSHPVSE
jgi:hypothetical protein